MVIVSDTTAISNLFKLKKLHFLKGLFQQIVIPTEVMKELLVLKDYGYDLNEIEDADWISVLPVEKNSLYEELESRLDIGETEAIVLSKQLNSDYLIMDEKKGRIEAERLEIKTIGILGILIQCRRSGLCSDLQKEMHDLKYDAGFWINDSLYKEILEIEKREFPAG